ncbi:MAG: DUF1826 domain-containing protein, partial [Bacteroidota bacterium]
PQIKDLLIGYFASFSQPCRLLLHDIMDLLDLFNQVASSTTYRLSVLKVESNMCRRFHTDVNDLRLLCTYKGRGTLWLPDDAVNRKAFLRQKDNRDDAFDESRIQEAGEGDVLLLKGALYPEAKAVVHRSPVIEKYNETRILLRIDTNEFLNFL